MSQLGIREGSARAARYEDGFRVLQGRREYVTYLDDSSIRIWYSDIPWRYETHDHSAVEVLLTIEGAVTYTVADTVYQVRKGEVLIIPPDMPHSLSMGEGSSRQLFLFEPDMPMNLRDVMNLPGLFSRVFWLHDGSETHTRIREMLLKIVAIQKNQDIMWNTLCYSYILRIYAALGQQYLPGAQRKKETARLVDQEVIAFKKQTGYFFKDYLCQKRLQVAMDLLIRTEVPMREVALQSGFGSVATFNRVFREKNGCTPTRYRAIYGTY